MYWCVNTSAEAIEASHGPASPEEISRLEEFIPTRLTSVTLLQVSVTISMAEFNLLHTLIPVILGYKVAPQHLVFSPLSSHLSSFLLHISFTYLKASLSAMKDCMVKISNRCQVRLLASSNKVWHWFWSKCG